MKKVLLMMATSLALFACSETEKPNPFFTEWDTPFGVPPFDQIENQHFVPAFELAIVQEKAVIDSITSNTEEPTFDNTIVALDQNGALMTKVARVFYGLAGTEATPELDSLKSIISAKLTAHGSDISLNQPLFTRVKAVYENRENLALDPESLRLVEKIYEGFARSGANLAPDKKERLRKLDGELAKLSIAFEKNLRHDNGTFALILTKEQLAGLPESVVAAAAQEATARGNEGSYAFTLDKASMLPFLQYADDEKLREQLYTGYLTRSNHDDEFDNKEVINQIVTLRMERAAILGFANHAAFVLDGNMAKDPAAVYSLLEELWTPAVKRAKKELAEMKKIKGTKEFNSWDWWYYAEKLRTQKYALDENELRPYFSMDNSINGIFELTTKLFGITYREITKEVPLYNKENRVYEVTDNNGEHLGVVYFDFHPRSSKNVGAWCTTFRGQSYKDGKKVAPVVSIVCNFTKPVGDTPALLTLDEVETLFHEYGHGLHQLFADVKYNSIKSVERDFVELPSQIMENWAFEPAVLAMYAKHYETGEVIPAELVEKIQKSSLFNQGFNTVEYLGASLLDLDYHTVVDPGQIDVNKFENESLSKYGLMAEIAPRYRSTYFKHIFSGGYSAGYYSYIWAEVLDADAYDAFIESGDLFDQATATRFRQEVLSRGGTSDGGVLYHNFRGKEASRKPLMKNRGLI